MSRLVDSQQFLFGASHPLSDSTTDRPSFDVKWTDLIGRAGGQDMFFLISVIVSEAEPSKVRQSVSNKSNLI